MSQGLIPSKSGTFLFDVTSRAGLRTHPASCGTAMERPVREPGSNAIVKDTLYFRTKYQS